MRKRIKYDLIEAKDKSGFSDWVIPNMKLYKLGCCDCGLVHDIKFKVDKKQALFKIRRNNRATGQIRRKKFKKD
jgi:hypothetical protein